VEGNGCGLFIGSYTPFSWRDWRSHWSPQSGSVSGRKVCKVKFPAYETRFLTTQLSILIQVYYHHHHHVPTDEVMESY